MKKKGLKTINIRVFEKDWKMLTTIAETNRRTLQDTFSDCVNLALKMHA